MANTLQPTDVYTLVNAAAKEMYGADSTLQARDTSSFVSVGEHMLRTGYTNTLNALSVVFGRTIEAVRPYRGEVELIARTRDEFGGIERKISFYSKAFEATRNFNTDINPSQLVDGQSIDHYVISKVYPLEINFCGMKTLEFSYTTFRKQLRIAFQSEAEFSAFYSAMMISVANDIAMGYEAENKLQVLNAIGATFNVGTARQKVNLTAEYNAKNSTSYTTAQLQTTYKKEFLAFFIERVKGDMELMRRNNALFHIFPARNDDAGNALTLLRHTPADMRRLFLYMPFVREAEAEVMPSLFNDSYLRLENYEGMEFWQNPNVPAAVDIVPNQMNVANGQSANGTRVQLDYVLGLLFDRDALATTLKLEDVITTPVNAKGDYYNTVYHWAYMFKQDQTENMILYYMAD